MNVIQFMALVESYYGKYERSAQKDIVRQYLAEKYIKAWTTSKELDVLYKRLLLEYSGKYRYAPDIAILEGIRRQLNVEVDGWRIEDVKLLPPEGCMSNENIAAELREILKKLAISKRLKEQGGENLQGETQADREKAGNSEG